MNVHKNTNLLRLEFWFCYSIKVSTLYHGVAAVIGSQAVLLASCSGWFSKSSPSVLSFRGRKSTQRLHPASVKAPVLLSNRLVCDFFFEQPLHHHHLLKKGALDIDSTGREKNVMKRRQSSILLFCPRLCCVFTSLCPPICVVACVGLTVFTPAQPWLVDVDGAPSEANSQLSYRYCVVVVGL